MRLLLDTNILLEVLLAQAKAEEAKKFLANPAEHDLFISDFSLHSIGVVLFRHKLPSAVEQFVKEMLFDGEILLLSLEPEDMDSVVNSGNRFNLDFDDAYQYALAEKYDLTLVSFDADYDRTVRGRKTPAQILSSKPA